MIDLLLVIFKVKRILRLCVCFPSFSMTIANIEVVPKPQLQNSFSKVRHQVAMRLPLYICHLQAHLLLAVCPSACLHLSMVSFITLFLIHSIRNIHRVRMFRCPTFGCDFTQEAHFCQPYNGGRI